MEGKRKAGEGGKEAGREAGSRRGRKSIPEITLEVCLAYRVSLGLAWERRSNGTSWGRERKRKEAIGVVMDALNPSS